MKKYFLLTAISAAIFLTACGTNDITADMSAQTSKITLNSATEMTVPAFESEWNETEVTSPAFDPSSNADISSATDAEITVPAYDPNGTEVDTALTTATENAEIPVYEAFVISNEGNYIRIRLKSDSFFGATGNEAYIYGAFEAKRGDVVEISFPTDQWIVEEIYPPNVRSDDVQVVVTGHESNEYEYSAKIFSVSNEYVTVMMLDNTFFCKMGEHVRLMGRYDVSEDELITFVINDDVDVDNPASANFVWQVDEADFVLKTAAADMTVEAEVTEFYESSDGEHFMVVEAYGLAGYYDAVPISLVTDENFEVGDRITVEFAPETIFMETSPLQVNKSDILNIEPIE